jgi:hypothetical protein
LWVNQVRTLHQLYSSKQNTYWQQKVKDSDGNPRRLWKTLNAVLCKDRSKSTSSVDGLTADGFLHAFEAKVQSVRASTASSPPPVFAGEGCKSTLAAFDVIDADYMVRLIRAAANKNCVLDPVPTWLVKQFAIELAPFLVVLFNTSMRSGTFPATQKAAIVVPALKKSTLDPLNMANYRPISNLSFVSKLLERCVHDQLNKYLRIHDLLPEVQSAYRSYHSTESAVLKVLSDVYAAADNKEVTLLCLLDLSAAFDTVDHVILVRRLYHAYGLRGPVLRWFQSYLTGRSQVICYNGQSSAAHAVCFGVPQGSVLGPNLFILYAADVIAIARRHGFTAHAYADDLQLYDYADPSSCASLITRLSACVDDVKQWMASSRLRLNASKTELIWLGAGRYVRECPMGPHIISGSAITPSVNVRDLGVVVDTELSLKAHVNYVTSTSYYHIRQLRLIRRSLTFDAAHSLVRAMIHSRLDYCNALLANAPSSLINGLQSTFRAAARLVLRLPSRASVSQVMRDRLHWLPVQQRITYKLCSIAFKCIHGTAPIYLTRMCTGVSTVPARASLRSAASGHLLVPTFRLSTMGRRGFYYSCPAAWNSLPASLTTNYSLSLRTFQKHLKTFLFRQ